MHIYIYIHTYTYIHIFIYPLSYDMICYYRVLLSYKCSNHPPQINEHLSRNFSNEEVFNLSKHQYEKAFRDNGYTDAELKSTPT